MNIGEMGYIAVLAFSAMGSATGVGIAGMAAVGSWKKCYVQNKLAPFLLITFIGAPLTQTIYGFLLLQAINGSTTVDPMAKLAMGVFGGIAIGLSAIYQGKVGAVASDALAETGKGLGQYIIAIGLCETVAIFVMAFLFITIG